MKRLKNIFSDVLYSNNTKYHGAFASTENAHFYSVCFNANIHGNNQDYHLSEDANGGIRILQSEQYVLQLNAIPYSGLYKFNTISDATDYNTYEILTILL